MAPTRHLFTTKQYGTSIGSPFDDKTLIGNLGEAVIRQITIGHDAYIHSLTVLYASESEPAVRRGGSSIKVDDVCLEPDEYITTIEGNVQDQVIGYLTFTTNKRSYGPFGTKAATEAFTLCATDPSSPSQVPRMGLLYFSGRCASGFINAIQATFADYAASGTHIKQVKYEQHNGDEPVPPASARLSGFAKNLMSPIVVLRVGPESIEFSTYQDTLCQLPLFRAALQGRFQEASEKVISMPEDDPGIISALIEFLYIGSYTYTYHNQSTSGGEDGSNNSGTPISDSAEGSFHATVYTVASKYDCQELADIALGNFKCVLNELKGFDVIRLLKAAYTNELVLSKLGSDVELAGFTQRLPELIGELYTTHHEQMERTIAEYPILGSDLLCLVTRGRLV